MKLLLLLLFSSCVPVTPFSAPSPSTRNSALNRMQELDFLPTNNAFFVKTLLSKPKEDQHLAEEDQKHAAATGVAAAGVALAALTMMPEPALATTSFALQSSLAAYAHVLSILAITGCLVAERLLIQTDMSSQDEDMVNQIDFVYGLLAALLIGSGFARAVEYGKGGDFYLHEVLFWVKMTLSGVWGGLSIFPTLIFRERKQLAEEAPPLSDPLVARLHSIINAEISAIWTIPLLASLMSNGVGYSPDLHWEAGAVVSVAATVGSFLYYGKQA